MVKRSFAPPEAASFSNQSGLPDSLWRFVHAEHSLQPPSFDNSSFSVSSENSKTPFKRSWFSGLSSRLTGATWVPKRAKRGHRGNWSDWHFSIEAAFSFHLVQINKGSGRFGRTMRTVFEANKKQTGQIGD